MRELGCNWKSNYMLFSDEEKAKLCGVVKMEREKLSRECVFFGHRNVQYVGEGRNENHSLWYHRF